MMNIYRVKSRNEYILVREVLYKHTWYVIIYQEEFVFCTCLLDRHLRIPCSHFFIVMQRFLEKYGFNIVQINQKWYNPFEKEYCLDRSWIYLKIINDIIYSKYKAESFINTILNIWNPDDKISSQLSMKII